MEAAKAIIEEEISTKLEISTNNSFHVADFGCSTGNNSFPAMHTIIEAVIRKYESSDLKTPEFYVWFNDVVSNDFNTLFRSLPPDRSYKTGAVAGDFHGRLLPTSSVHFAYSSCSLHWLTEVPKAAEYLKSVWHGGEEREEAYVAYLSQFERDIESFLKCRAVEMVEGGIMALLIPGVPDSWDPLKEYTVGTSLISAIVGHGVILPNCNESHKLYLRPHDGSATATIPVLLGRLSDAILETFNIPYHFATPKEIRDILEKSNSFNLERMDVLKNGTFLNVDGHVACFRAVHQNMFAHMFGAETVDETFDLLKKKLQSSPAFANPLNDRTLFIVAILKHKHV
ncbi:hypothetical protein SASPL_151360 [Salvia splendens]|uniref:Jasmonate O-methyltransferase n=1 Tax=Salvia splendens TaxID=180675 RepID=A0A8X8W8C0_SALSN|nr:hypothetical protein SASPL_151360 [Salvia splendens]